MWLIIIVFLQLPAKEGFPVTRVICHESVIYVTGHVSHRSEAQGLLPRTTRQTETFWMATKFRCRMLAIYQSLLLFLGLTYRVSPLLWDKYYIIARWLTAYSKCCIDVHSHFRAHDRLVDCGNSYTLPSFMLIKCHCLPKARLLQHQ